MFSKTVEIVNESGLHARPASDFVKAAKAFESKITIKNLTRDTEPVNAKSIVRLLASGFSKGTRAELRGEGPDEESAVTALAALIASGFGE